MIKILIAPTIFSKLKFKDKILVECSWCKNPFNVKKQRILFNERYRKTENIFCSRKCFSNFQKTGNFIRCKQCNNEVYVFKCNINKNIFCSQSCAATYNNQHKSYGFRRSKLEIWLEQQLPKLYSNIEFHFNKKDAINSELDIYIPQLKVAFELNGIFHYEPIYSQEQLKRTQDNDNRKFQACLERGIEFCIIDTSKQKYFCEKTALPYLKIIQDIIDKKLVQTERI